MALGKKFERKKGFLGSDIDMLMRQGQSLGVQSMQPIADIKEQEYGVSVGSKPRIASGEFKGSYEKDIMVGSFMNPNGDKTSISDLTEIYRKRLANIKDRVAAPGRPTSLFMNKA